MDGFGGYKNAATSVLPGAVTVMDPFYDNALAGAQLDLCRQRVQQDTRAATVAGPGNRSTASAGPCEPALSSLSARQKTRLEAVFADEAHPVEVKWGIYQQVIDACVHPDPRQGKMLLARVIDILRAGVPAGARGTRHTRSKLHRRRDVLACFTPTEPRTGRPRLLTADPKPYAAAPSASAT